MKLINKTFVAFALCLGLLAVFFVNSNHKTYAYSGGPTVRAWSHFYDLYGGDYTKSSNWGYLNGGTQMTPVIERWPTRGYLGISFGTSDDANYITRLCYTIQVENGSREACIGHGVNSSYAYIDPAGNPQQGYDTWYVITGVRAESNPKYSPIKQARLTFTNARGNSSVTFNVSNSGKLFWTTPINNQDGLRGFNNIGFGLDLISGGTPVAPGPFSLSAISTSCSNLKPLNSLRWTASSAATSYSVYRSGSSSPIYTTTGNSYDDTSANNSATYSYWVVASNGISPPATSNTQTITTPNCDPAPTVSLYASQLEITSGSSVQLTWRSTNGLGVSYSNFGAGYSQLNNMNPGITVSPTQTTTYAIIITGSQGRTATSSLTVRVISVSVKGDVYSPGDISGIKFDPLSVISAGGTINIVGSNYTLPKYSLTDSAGWLLIQSRMAKNVNRLKSESAIKLPGLNRVENKIWYLNAVSDPLANPGNFVDTNPDGKTWVISGDLTLNNVSFKGVGTIIVDGNVTIEGNISYIDNTSSLGIISLLGNLNIKPAVYNVIGAYYIGGQITIEK